MKYLLCRNGSLLQAFSDSDISGNEGEQ